MMRWHTIPPLVRKDLRLYFSNRFYTFITVFSLLGMIAAYLLTPRTVDETLRLGVYAPGDVGQAIDALGEGEEGLEAGQYLLLDLHGRLHGQGRVYRSDAQVDLV